MRQGHFAIIFCTIYVVFFMLLQLEQIKFDKVQMEKQRIEEALQEAIEHAGKEFSSVLNESEIQKKRVLEQTFFESLYISLGIFEEPEKQENLRMYLPMLALVEEDGVFFYHMVEKNNGKEVEIMHIWSEKIPYAYEKECSEQEKKKYIVRTLEEKASRIISNHNHIASQYGISYIFSVPEFLVSTSENIEFPILLAVFQGWPLNVAGDVFYENCIDTGVYLQRVKQYIITGPEQLSEPYFRYHIRDCPYVEDKELAYTETVSEEEAVIQYGAFPCDNCIIRE